MGVALKKMSEIAFNSTKAIIVNGALREGFFRGNKHLFFRIFSLTNKRSIHEYFFSESMFSYLSSTVHCDLGQNKQRQRCIVTIGHNVIGALRLLAYSTATEPFWQWPSTTVHCDRVHRQRRMLEFTF